VGGGRKVRDQTAKMVGGSLAGLGISGKYPQHKGVQNIIVDAWGQGRCPLAKSPNEKKEKGEWGPGKNKKPFARTRWGERSGGGGQKKKKKRKRKNKGEAHTK